MYKREWKKRNRWNQPLLWRRHVQDGATMEAFRESKVLWWVLLMILSQALKNNIPRDLQQERSILPGHVCEPGHHGVLQGVQSVTMDPVDDSLPSATLLKWSSIGPTITLRTPWMPPWCPGSRTLRPSGSQTCCWDPVDDLLPSATPWTFFWKPSWGLSTGPNHNTPWRPPMVAHSRTWPLPQEPGGNYASQVPLLL